MKKSNPKQRSIQWFGRQDIYGFLYRSWVKNRGVPHDMFDGRPVIGICNTWSELTPCNTHFRVLADHVRQGVLEAGGFPLEFPVMSLGETLMRPTAMLYRNLASMDVEESIRANPLDGVVLLAGCDKTTPATLMGACSVDLVKENVCLSRVLAREAFENAIRALAAIGGSTNAVIHLTALARRIGVHLDLDDFDRLGRGVHTLVNLMPSGKYLMEDFYYAGGLPAVLRELGENNLLQRDALTVNGKTIWENNKDAPCWNRDVIHGFKSPFKKGAGIAVLRGSLCPDGAIIKPSAATPKLMTHRARAVVFQDIEDFHRRIDDPKLDIDENCVMVLKNCGPKGYPGMAEVGNMPLPPKLLKKGVTDMVRISDARMSGTAYGTVVLHVCPEAAAGGALALVENGDMIELNVEKRRLVLQVTEDVLLERRKKWKQPPAPLERGYWKLYFDHVLQASEGADLDFLVGKSGAFVPRDNHCG